MAKRTVLSSDDINRSLKRISHEIVEATSGSQDLVILGIPTRGVALAQRLARNLSDLYPQNPLDFGTLDVTLYRDDGVSASRRPYQTDTPIAGIDDKIVILVDDVLYSGRTVRAALDALVDIGRPRQVKLAVLVDRGHRELPIRPDFVGKNLPTSSEERVNVRLVETDGVDEVVIEE
jgi:pyrimidine operon attenuation protein/uracil phosphoribosyltransferase